jgi:Raf kinase inhibitor-like YbhB/YbcL family protein
MSARTLTFVFALALASLASAQAAPFKVVSQDLNPMQPIAKKFVFKGFGCTGENVSPEIGWKHAPAGTKSFALMVHDPDAPTGGAGFWHWVVINIPATTTALPEGAGNGNPGSALPAGVVQIHNDYSMAGWGGPCPPVGDKPHRYVFTVYALKVAQLKPPVNATASLVGFLINQSTLAKASLTARYGR